MDNSLEQLIEFTKKTSKQVVEELGEQHEFILLSDNGNQISIANLIVDKQNLRQAVLLALRTTNAINYVLIGEAIRTFPKYTEGLIREEITQKDIPQDDKVDVLTILYTKKGEQPRALEAVIIDTNNGRKVGEWKDIELPIDTSGVFTIKDW